MTDSYHSLHRYASEALMSATSEDLSRPTTRGYLDTAQEYAEKAAKVGNKSEAIVSQCLILAAKLVRMERDL